MDQAVEGWLFTIAYVAIAFVVAATGGLVGGLLHNRFVGIASTSPAYT